MSIVEVTSFRFSHRTLRIVIASAITTKLYMKTLYKYSHNGSNINNDKIIDNKDATRTFIIADAPSTWCDRSQRETDLGGTQVRPNRRLGIPRNNLHVISMSVSRQKKRNLYRMIPMIYIDIVTFNEINTNMYYIYVSLYILSLKYNI